MKRLAIQEEREEDKYSFTTTLRSWPDSGQLIPDASENSKVDSVKREYLILVPSDLNAWLQVKTLVDGIMNALSSARQSEVKAWEEEITACEHTLTLEQTSTEHIRPNGMSSDHPVPDLEIQSRFPLGLAHCSKCELGENLWLCLTCGSLGCGRQQFGGIGGNGHGLNHFEETSHPVAVKLGTITAEGNAGTLLTFPL